MARAHRRSHRTPTRGYAREMRTFLSLLIVLATSASVGGCFVQTGPQRGPTAVRRERECPPAHHWEDGECVHNGKAKGHDK